jgi:hypothetical protein
MHQELIIKIKKLEAALAEAEAALPAHTIRPHQMQRVLDLEEELDQAKRELADWEAGEE